VTAERKRAFILSTVELLYRQTVHLESGKNGSWCKFNRQLWLRKENAFLALPRQQGGSKYVITFSCLAFLSAYFVRLPYEYDIRQASEGKHYVAS
jgi:hypothetical protein